MCSGYDDLSCYSTAGDEWEGNTVLQTTSFSDSIDCVAVIDDEERITLILLNTKKKVINIRIHESTL